MLLDFLDILLQKDSASLLCGAGSITVFAFISGIDWVITRLWMEIKSKWEKEERYMKGVAVLSHKGSKCVDVADNLVVPQIRSSDEVLIKVIAAGADPIDLKVSYGYCQVVRSYIRRYCKGICKDFPVILGRDCSGIVIETGNDVTSVREGDKVWAVSSYFEEGLMAEYVVVKETQVSLKPESLSFEEAASLAYVSVIIWDVFMNHAKLCPNNAAGKRTLVYTSNNAYGLLAVQLLKAWECHVTAAVPTTGLPMCRILGSDDVVVYTVTNFQEELKSRKKFDIILNFAGSVLHRFSLDLLCADNGRVVTLTSSPAITDKYGLFTGLLMHIKLRLIYWLKMVLFGFSCRISFGNILMNSDSLKAASQLFDNCNVRPICEVYSLQRAKEAFKEMGTYSTVGRTVISFNTNDTENGYLPHPEEKGKNNHFNAR